MKENHATFCNKILYYVLAPCLLLYFVMIDIGFITSSIGALIVFGILIIFGVTVPMIYKKKNSNYKFNLSSKYANIMAVLVMFELAYNFYK